MTGSVSTDLAAYFETRCKMIARHYKEMQAYKLFDIIVEDLFNKADSFGVLPEVKNAVMQLILQNMLESK